MSRLLLIHVTLNSNFVRKPSNIAFTSNLIIGFTMFFFFFFFLVKCFAMLHDNTCFFYYFFILLLFGHTLTKSHMEI